MGGAGGCEGMGGAGGWPRGREQFVSTWRRCGAVGPRRLRLRPLCLRPFRIHHRQHVFRGGDHQKRRRHGRRGPVQGEVSLGIDRRRSAAILHVRVDVAEHRITEIEALDVVGSGGGRHARGAASVDATTRRSTAIGSEPDVVVKAAIAAQLTLELVVELALELAFELAFELGVQRAASSAVRAPQGRRVILTKDHACVRRQEARAAHDARPRLFGTVPLDHARLILKLAPQLGGHRGRVLPARLRKGAAAPLEQPQPLGGDRVLIVCEDTLDLEPLARRALCPRGGGGGSQAVAEARRRAAPARWGRLRGPPAARRPPPAAALLPPPDVWPRGGGGGGRLAVTISRGAPQALRNRGRRRAAAADPSADPSAVDCAVDCAVDSAAFDVDEVGVEANMLGDALKGAEALAVGVGERAGRLAGVGAVAQARHAARPPAVEAEPTAEASHVRAQM